MEFPVSLWGFSATNLVHSCEVHLLEGILKEISKYRIDKSNGSCLLLGREIGNVSRQYSYIGKPGKMWQVCWSMLGGNSVYYEPMLTRDIWSGCEASLLKRPSMHKI